MTEAYSWVGLSSTMAESPTFTVPSATLAARYGQSIEFKLTVTDGGTPSLTNSTTLVFNLNQGPSADIAVSAMLADPANPDVPDYDDNGNGVKDENAERYPLDGVIDGPGENGNADNEWDIAEGALITLDGSGSSDPNGKLAGSDHVWTLVYSSGDGAYDGAPSGSLPGTDTPGKKISTDDDPSAVSADETMLPLGTTTGRPAPKFYAFYKLTVTDSKGAEGTALVRLVIHDQPANPRVATLVPSLTDAADGVSKLSAEVVPPKSGKYVIAPGSKITVTATASDADGDTPNVSWEGAQATAPGASTARFTAPSTAEEGDDFTITATATDVTGRTGSKSVVLVVATNTKPDAVAPGTLAATQLYSSITVNDGPDGGDVVNGRGTGVVKLRGIGFDPDGDPLIFNWTELAMARDDNGDVVMPSLDATYAPQNMPGAIKLPLRARVNIDNAFSEDGASFQVPEVTARDQLVDHDGDAATPDVLAVPIAFTVIDKWSVSSTKIVIVFIRNNDDTPVANAGPDQQVNSGSFVRLNGSGSSDSDPGDQLKYEWTYVGITTDPATDKRVPISAAEKGYGYVECKWFPYDGTDDDGDCDDGATKGTYSANAGGALKNQNTAYPYFDAPKVGQFDSVTLTFRLLVTDGQATTDDTDDDDVSRPDLVRITITDGFYSGQITGPSFCLARSLGGPMTYAYDSDGDDVADVCSLNTTRRATVARQNALETLAALNPQTFKDHLHGKDVQDDPDTHDVDESLKSIPSQCAAAPKNLGDSAAALAADSCGNGKGQVSAPPKPVDPAKADEFFSGVINGASYCANSSLGGPTTYAMDSDGDGVADVCSLPFTRREAVARQNALATAFGNHAQYGNALKAACSALGTTGFGDNPADLAKDACDRPPAASTGTPLPSSG